MWLLFNENDSSLAIGTEVLTPAMLVKMKRRSNPAFE
jgi:hypothetical protein